MPTALECALIVQYIDELRKEEGSGLEINSTNAEGEGPNNELISITSDWTDWIPRLFRGPTLLDALAEAVRTKNQINK